MSSPWSEMVGDFPELAVELDAGRPVLCDVTGVTPNGTRVRGRAVLAPVAADEDDDFNDEDDDFDDEDSDLDDEDDEFSDLDDDLDDSDLDDDDE